MMRFIRLQGVRRGSVLYNRLTKECYRVDRTTIERAEEEVPGLLSPVRRWLQGTRFRMTRHVSRGIQRTLNMPSRNGRYTEVLPCELSFLRNLPRFLHCTNMSRLILVELGFNYRNVICKVAIVVPMHDLPPQHSPPTYPSGMKRYLFLCIGIDGGIKTAYINDRYKERYQYRGAPYLSAWSPRRNVVQSQWRASAMSCIRERTTPLIPTADRTMDGSQSFSHGGINDGASTKVDNA